MHYHIPMSEHDADARKMLPQSQHPAVRCTESVSFEGNLDLAIFHPATHSGETQQPHRFDGALPLGGETHRRGGTHATDARMITSHHHDDVTHGGAVPAMTSAPGPYDCKPPYSYISLIAMAIESSPDRRYIIYN